MIHLKKFSFNPLSTCCYVIWDEGKKGSAVVDPGMIYDEEINRIFSFLEENALKPEKILLTHGHFDHVYGVAPLVERFGCEVFMHPSDKERTEEMNVLMQYMDLDAPRPFEFTEVHENDHIKIGDLDLEVMEIPGHTEGSVAWVDREDKVVFTGDTLMKDSIGRTDLPGGDYDCIIKSLMDKLMGLDGDYAVLPGHGPETSIGYEASHNPFLIPFNEPDDHWWEQDGIPLSPDSI